MRPSSKKDTTDTAFHTYESNGSGFHQKFEYPESIRESKLSFAKNFAAWSGKPNLPLADILGTLRQELLLNVADIRTVFLLRITEQTLKTKIKGVCGDCPQTFLDLKNKQKVELEADRFSLQERHRAWIAHCDAVPFWMVLFGFFWFVRKHQTNRNINFLLSNDIQIEIKGDSGSFIDEYFKKKAHSLLEKIHKTEDEIQKAQKLLNEINDTRSDIDKWRSNHKILENECLEEYLDTTLRTRSFFLATHYWECQWLIDSDLPMFKTLGPAKTEKQVLSRLRKYGKLTPCFVSTFHTLPSFFKGSEDNSYALESIDLLIVDEAGQVPPDVAIASFALAKRALVIGDTLQIQPVWGVSKPVDRGNLHRYVLDKSNKEHTFSAFQDLNLCASSGNLMALAQRRSEYSSFKDSKGMFLAEHQRWVPEIIRYCNELAYQNRLIPKRNSLTSHVLPPLGYFHIEGECKPLGSSRVNLEEAETLAAWVAHKWQCLRDTYPGKQMEDVIAIVTPFKPQEGAIKNEFIKRKMTDRLTI